MLMFGISLRSHNPFLGYHADFDEAAASCFKTALIFLILSILSIVSFAITAVRAKMTPPIPRTEYTAV